MVDEAKLHSPVCSTSEVLVVWCWALSVDQCRLQALQFLVHLVDLISILLRYNGFARIQKAVVDQMGSRSTKQGPWPFFGCKFDFHKCFGTSFLSNHWAGCFQLWYKIHFSSHITIWLRNCSLLCRIREDNTFKQRLFKNFRSAHEASIYQAFSFFKFAPNAKWP